MFEEAISLLSLWSSMNSWLTPTVLFLLLNLMIGTIAVTSGFTSHKPSNHHLNHPEPTFHHYHQPPLQPQLTRSPSILQRLKSINLYTLNSPPPSTLLQPPPTTHLQPPPPQPVPTPEPHFSTTSISTPTTAADDDESPTLDEIYSRIKQENPTSHFGRQNSDTKPSGGEIPVKLPKKMKKSASDKSAFNHFHIQEDKENVQVAVHHTAVPTVDEEERGENNTANAPPLLTSEEREDEGVDAKADDFINKFKKQLQMQRNASIFKS